MSQKKSSPCGGCPPCCNQCVFTPVSTGVPQEKTIEVVPKKSYGCILPTGGAVVLSGGVLGMMREENFHPVTFEGARFLRETGNPLATHC